VTSHKGGDPLSRKLGDERFAPLTSDDVKRIGDGLLAARAAGDKAAERRLRDELVERHLRLIVALGKGYQHKLDSEDILAVGSLALMEAMSRWDPTPGGMSPYQWARRWVLTALNKATDASRTIRIPEQVAYRAALNTKLVRERENVLGRPLTDAEVVALTGGGVRLEDLPLADRSIYEPLFAYATNEHDLTIEDVTADPTASAEETVERDDLHARVRAALDTLTDDERTVVRHRFGLDGRDGLTLAELGEMLGTSGEAIRRLEASALAKLTHPANPHSIGDTL
jgi:RNA polymerase primary sigma factor